MNNVTTMAPARSLGVLTLACALCCLPLISAAQDATPPPPHQAGRPRATCVSQTNGSFNMKELP